LETDKLEFLFNKQKALIQEIENAQNKMQAIYKTPEVFEGYRMFMLASALLHEVIELQRETNWKWWKATEKISIERCQKEVIDIWHFLIQLSMEVGLNANDIVNIYIEKHAENIDRQREGY
jgi:dimeric dUTPase (all-alpha-NTP-PPase superfamily)